MASIKRWGVVAGGAAAGLVLALTGAGTGWLVLLPALSVGFPEGYEPDTVTPLVLRVVVGFVLIWVYVGFRPRFGAGSRAILGAVAAVWLVSSATLVSAVAILDVLPPLTTALATIFLLIELLVAGFTGATVYRRYAARSTRRRGRPHDVMP